MLIKSIARSRFVSIPPRKMRLVGDQIKGMPVEAALNALHYCPRVAARHLAKTLKSAAANALSIEGTDHLKPEDLVIKNVLVDAAPMAKRIRFQSMGRVFRIRKRHCHLTILLEGEAEAPAPKARRGKKAAGGEDIPAKKSAAKPKAKTAGKTGVKAKTKASNRTAKPKAKPAAREVEK